MAQGKYETKEESGKRNMSSRKEMAEEKQQGRKKGDSDNSNRWPRRRKEQA